MLFWKVFDLDVTTKMEYWQYKYGFGISSLKCQASRI